MNRLEQVLIIVLALVCFGCQKTAKQVEQPMMSMKDGVATIESPAEVDSTSSPQVDPTLRPDSVQASSPQAEKATPKEIVPAPAEEKTSAAGTAPTEDDALIASLNKASGATKIDIINKLGERGNPKSVFALAGLIYDEDAAVASAAVKAIGKIGGVPAANILATAKRSTRGELRNTVLGAYLNCANQFAAKGERVQAIVIYQRLYDSNEPVQIRIAALHGIVLSTGGQSAQIFADALKKEGPIQTAAIALLREMPAEELLKASAEELPNVGPAAKVQMLAALADAGYKAALPAVVEAVKDQDVTVRLAALKAIGRLGGASEVQLLAETAANGGTEEREIARQSLYQLSGPDVDSAIAAALTGAEPRVKVELIHAIGGRNITSAAEILLVTSKDSDPKVRMESAKALQIVAGPEQLMALIELLKDSQGQPQTREIEKVVAAAANKISDENQRASVVIAAMENATDVDVKSSLIRVLGRIGTESALAAVRDEMNDKDVNIQEVAIRTLGDWPNPEPMEDMLRVVQTTTNKVFRMLALHGYVQLVGLDSKRPEEETAKLYMRAMELAGSADEKRMVLAGLSNVQSYAAIEAAMKSLGDEQVGAEAAGAIIQIAERTKGADNPEQTKAVLRKVIETVKTEQMRKQAEEVLSKIK